MPLAYSSPPIVCTGGPLAEIDADLLIVPWFEDDAAGTAGVDAATGGEVARAVAAKEFQAKTFELFLAPVTDRGWRAKRVALVGGGSGERGSALLRKLATTAGLAARQRRVGRVAFAVRGAGDALELAQAVSEGLTLAEFHPGKYKTSDPPPAAPPVWTVVMTDASDRLLADGCAAVARGRILGECSNMARALANEPGNTLTPREFASRAGGLAADAGVSVEILDEKQIADLGMGLLLGVARGSSEPPRLRVFRH
jgi:leucyl aminopeptidase